MSAGGDGITLRPAQEAILAYRNGRMAVSAVPGSGKTFTLSLLAAQLIAAEGRVDVDAGQQVLVVTFLNSSVDTFKARIRQRLEQLGLPAQQGFDVRTLHSLALEIVRTAHGGLEDPDGPQVLDALQKGRFLAQAIDRWQAAHPQLWAEFVDESDSRARRRWRGIVEQMADGFIRTAKNERYRPEAIIGRLRGAGDDPDVNGPLLQLLSGIYANYQALLTRQGALDYDDMIWQAVDLLEERPHLTEQLRQRWPYVLEDEAQDSIPLQELLLENLVGPDGNWVRVGDPNQAITSTFTAAHPRYFNAFLKREGVVTRPLPNSGRNAPLIYEAANTVVDWVVDNHPVPEVREQTFRRQHIAPTPPGDAQPNPPDDEARIEIKVFTNREEDELPAVARRAYRYVRRYPGRTAAILVPTNYLGYQVADRLDEFEAPYDSLLRGGGREREVAGGMQALLALLAEPLKRGRIADAHAALAALEHPAALVFDGEEDGGDAQARRFQAVLESVYEPEALLFPAGDGVVSDALPAGVAEAEEVAAVGELAAFLRRLFALRPLPVDDLALALGDELFARGDRVREADLAIAYQIANVLRHWRDLHPDWRLPDLADELGAVAQGRSRLPVAGPNETGFEPQRGRITLATQHSAKGLEWDAVFLVGVDGAWVPGDLDAYFRGDEAALGGDPTAEATAQLRHLMVGDAGIFDGRTATESAHIEVIGERLRLLYVGLTRARRYLHISRSRATRRAHTGDDTEPATVMGVIYRYLQARRKNPAEEESTVDNM